MDVPINAALNTSASAVQSTPAGTAAIKAQYLRKVVDAASLARKRPAESSKTPSEGASGESFNGAPVEAAEKKQRSNDDYAPAHDAANDIDPNGGYGDGRSRGGGKGGRGGRGRGRGGKGRDYDKKSRGMNKARERGTATDGVQICNEFVSEGGCTRGESCKFPHDVDAFLAAKGADIGTTCRLYETFGRCKFGVRCRFAGAHTGPHTEQLVNHKLVAEVGTSKELMNWVNKETLRNIQKNNVPTPGFDDATKWMELSKSAIGAKDNFSRKIIKLWAEERKSAAKAEVAAADANSAMEVEPAAASDGDASVVTSEVANVGTSAGAPNQQATGGVDESMPTGDDYDRQFAKIDQAEREAYLAKQSKYEEETAAFMSRFPKKKTIDLRGKIYLAPLTTVGNVPFRRIAKKFGADVTCGEMAVSTKLLSGHNPEWALMRRHPDEDIFGVQISAHNFQTATKAAEMVRLHCPDIDFVDLNCGCPIDLITRGGSGSALLDRRNRLKEIVLGMGRVLNIPVSVKLRTGVKSDSLVAHKLAPMLKQCGASIITLHGRSKEQRYSKFADWDYINQVASTVVSDVGEHVNFFGNGDVLSHEDYYGHLNNPNNKVGGVMIGRGALMKPWIFKEIKERKVYDIRSSERLDILRDFANFGLEHWGSDTMGVNTTRRYMLEWLSFLYRYVPVELLEVLPQKVNQRPPPFYGRDDLETLMASPIATDWIKITEMLLGPTPADFHFTPKHKSSANDSEAGIAYENVDE
ncbi:tRNA-dihydrouridine(47) synthase [NAD(P)(+)]-like protein [Irineochytrium annulatum]|nr:tRNA-dihydrouridine(47) synthase [NAD(P)(+)]-like protein [Irineochytrium annulatum]